MPVTHAGAAASGPLRQDPIRIRRGRRGRAGLALAVTTMSRATVALGLLLVGCVERTERITIREDGSVEIAVRHVSESMTDLLEGDALPDIAEGLVFDLRSEERGDGVRHVFEANWVSFVGASLPGRYGPPDDPFGEQVLSFPTSLVVEERRDGIWWHFRRVYQPRRWAEWGALRDPPAARRLESLAAVADELIGSAATWRFDGATLFDRPRELLVSSRTDR